MLQLVYYTPILARLPIPPHRTPPRPIPILPQAQQLLDEVTRFREGHERGRGLPPGSIPLIVAGDFNAAPHRSKAGSGGYEPMCFRQVTSHPLALQSAFPLEGAFTTWKIRPGPKPAAAAVVEDAAGGGGSAEGDGVTGAEGGGGREVGGGGGGGEKAMVGTKETKHCIDYMWVSEGVQPTRHSLMPTEEQLGPLRAPSFVYPSDHFAVAVDLVLPCARV